MTEIILEPPCDLINANSRLHHHAKAKLTRIWRAAAREAAHEIGPLRFEHAHIVVTYRFPTNHRREVSNLQPTSKAMVDGLVDAGVLEDDSDDYVTGPDNRRERPNGPLRVTITLTEEIAA
jgi:hypothetical protein